MYNYVAGNFGIIKHPVDVQPNIPLLKYKGFSKQQREQESMKLKRNTLEDRVD